MGERLYHLHLIGLRARLSRELVVGCQHFTDNCLLSPQDLLSFSLKDGKWICCLCDVGAGQPVTMPHLCLPQGVTV